MARNVTLTPQTVTIAATKAGSTVFDIRYNPTLSTTLVDGSVITYTEGTTSGVFTDSTTTTVNYIHQINDDLVTKYS
jgi:hypothetical protein